MNRVMVFAALALAASLSPAHAGPPPVSPAPIPAIPSRFEAMGSEANFALIDLGAQAPDFAFEAQGLALRLHDLRAQGNVLLVIEPDEKRLAEIQRERVRLLSIGVVPVAIMDRSPGACAALGDRLRLSFELIPDSRRVIGAQFNALDPNSRANAPAWFVLDRGGRVRDFAHLAWPTRPWTEVTSIALGLPAPQGTVPASATRRFR